MLYVSHVIPLLYCSYNTILHSTNLVIKRERDKQENYTKKSSLSTLNILVTYTTATLM